MNKKTLVLFVCFIVALLTNNKESVYAIESELTKVDPDISTLVVFTSESGEMDEHQRLLDLSLGHFSGEVTYKNSKEVNHTDLEGKTHLVYHGKAEEELPPNVSRVISSFDGPTLAIGHNVEQLGEDYSFVQLGGEAVIERLDYVGDEEKTREIEPNVVFETTVADNTDILVQGSGEQGDFPLIMQNNENYYYASDKLLRPYSVYFSQALNSFYGKETIDRTPAYIRLEDVHPLSDPSRLMTVAQELAEREIPYMIAVIPVYTNSETGKDYHFEDSPEVLEALRFMQDNGGSVVLHGYSHQYRDSETGEGFEFWDVENQRPIYQGPEEDVTILTEGDFQTEEEYNAYMEENKEFERQYIEDRLTRGVQELTNYGIHPLAFEAPHYTMSQHGYEVVSSIFSTYVGQIQLSDERWEIMNTTPYPSEPTVLNDMQLLPETVGFMDTTVDDPLQDMVDSAELYQVTDGGILGAFYHPYLGVEGLRDVLNEMEKVENLEWIDLKELDNQVAVDNVMISSQHGEVQAEVDRLGLLTASVDFPIYHIAQITIRITWIIAVIAIAAVLIFLGFIFYQRTRRRQRHS